MDTNANVFTHLQIYSQLLNICIIYKLHTQGFVILLLLQEQFDI